MVDPSDLLVDGRRLRRSLEAVAEIGGTPDGEMHRLALSDDDKRARDLLVTWLEEAGARVERRRRWAKGSRRAYHRRARSRGRPDLTGGPQP